MTARLHVAPAPECQDVLLREALRLIRHAGALLEGATRWPDLAAPHQVAVRVCLAQATTALFDVGEYTSNALNSALALAHHPTRWKDALGHVREAEAVVKGLLEAA